MLRIRALLGILALAVVIGGVSYGDEKPKAKGQLPPNWKKLGLSDEQVKKIYAAQAEYREKITDLEAKIADLKKQEQAELTKVLSPEQKELLKKILLDKVGDKDAPVKDK